jgi:hypothetical protein
MWKCASTKGGETSRRAQSISSRARASRRGADADIHAAPTVRQRGAAQDQIHRHRRSPFT